MSERRNTTNDRRTNDRRRTQRSPIDCQIRMLSTAAPSEVLQASLLDVSASGLRLIGSHAITVGEKLLIEARRAARVVCNVTVQVIWSEADPAGHFIIGCESIADFSPRQLSQLKTAAADAAVVADT
jgi:PilZ domain-containing protein